MKKIFLLLFIFVSIAFSAIDECKTDVYFGNGILTEKKDARTNSGILRDAIIEKFGFDYYKKHIGKVDYAYNHTYGMGWDLLESYSQISNTQGLKDWWVNHLLPENKKTVHEADLTLQVNKYEASIKNGHKVLLVAYLQGNLFTNEVYKIKKQISIIYR